MLIAAGVGLDALFMNPHATVRVTLRDGSQRDLERHGPKGVLTDIMFLYDAMADSRPGAESCRERPDKRTQGITPLECPSDITAIKMLRGPSYWWWTDSSLTKVAVGLIALLWIVFYTVRWIVRGFSTTGISRQ
jgi:hypothetical protein